MAGRFESKADAYRRLQESELETARFIRDLIASTDDTRKLWKMIKSVAQAGEARVLGDMGEGKYPDGKEFSDKDFWIHVGEVRGIRSVPAAIERMMQKADEEDAKGQPDSNAK